MRNIRRSISAFLAAVILGLTVFAGCLTGCSKTPAETVSVNIDYGSASVAYLGPEGTYSQEACEVFFGKKDGFVPYKTVAEAVASVGGGECKYAVIPQENTIGGAVTDYVDIVIGTTGISVVGEVELTINQNLLVVPGTSLDQIKTVYSHAQGIAQGKEWLAANLPGAEIVEVSSTAEGAKIVSGKNDKSCAAIGAAACADVYKLEVLASGIQNSDSNKTRFYVLSTQAPATAKAARLVFVASGDAKDLPELLALMKDRGMELVTINSRPAKTRLGEYNYLIECSGCSYEAFLKVKEKAKLQVRYLGSFDVK